MHDGLIEEACAPETGAADVIDSNDFVPWQGLECNEFTGRAWHTGTAGVLYVTVYREKDLMYEAQKSCQ